MAVSTTLKYVPEDPDGSTPVDSTDWKYITLVSDGVTANPQTTKSQRQRADRNPTGHFVTGMDVGGAVAVEYSLDLVSDMMAYAMNGTWSAGDLVVGSVDTPLVLERDYGVAKFVQYKGVRVNQMEITVPVDGLVTGNITFMGQTAPVPTVTSVVGESGSTAAGSSLRPLVGATDVDSIILNHASAETDILIQQVTLSLGSNYRPVKALKTLGAKELRLGGMHTVEGTLDLHMSLDTLELYDEIVGQTPVNFSFAVKDGTTVRTFHLPRVFLSGGPSGTTGPDSDIMQQTSFVADFDDTAGYAIQVTDAAQV